MADDTAKKYGLILADPPWDYRNGGNGRARAHYPTMTVDAICDLPVLDVASANSVLVLWTTWPQLSGALRVVPAWGFEYVTGFPWIKFRGEPMPDLFNEMHTRPSYGTGAWVRGCSELVLISKRGKAKPPDGHMLGLLSDRFEHSRKPHNIYHYCEQFDGPYLELFARRKRDGWDSWGNEIESSITLTEEANEKPS